MTITPAQFALWLQKDTRRMLLLEQQHAYESGGAPAIGTMYLSSAPFRTSFADSPANISYRSVISKAAYSRALDVAALGGKGTFTPSAVTLNNLEGELDDFLSAIVDGYEGRLYLGDPSWKRSDFQLVAVVVAENMASSTTELTITYRDKRLLLDRQVRGNAVGGTGPNATKYLPLMWGSHSNVEPLLFDEATIQYSVLSNYSGVSVAAAVRDDGVSLRGGGWSATAANTTVNAATDTFTHAAHGLAVDDVIFFADPIVSGGLYLYWAAFPGMSARPYWVKTVPDANTFTLSATKGGTTLDITGTTWSDSGSGLLAVVRQRFFDDLANTGRIQLSSTPAGRVTMDLRANIVGTDPFALALTLIQTYGNVTASDYDNAAFAAAGTALAAKISMGYVNLYLDGNGKNLIGVLDDIIKAGFGWYGQDNLGRLTCGLLDPPNLSAATATRTLNEKQLVSEYSLENQPVTVGRANVIFGLNTVDQADGLSSSITLSSRATYSSDYASIAASAAPSATGYLLNPQLYHKSMVDSAPQYTISLRSSFYGSDTAISFGGYANEIVKDRRPHLKVLKCATRLENFDWGLGEVVNFTGKRFGYVNGQNFRMVRIDVDLIAESVAMQLLTYAQPTYTRASYS